MIGMIASIFGHHNRYPETNSSHLKPWGWKVTFLLGSGLFSVAYLAVSFMEGNFKKHTKKSHLDLHEVVM